MTEEIDVPAYATVMVEFDGDYYEVPEDSRNWPLEVIDAQEEGKNLGVIRSLIGEEQYAKFRAKPRTLGDFEDFTNKLVKAGVRGK